MGDSDRNKEKLSRRQNSSRMKVLKIFMIICGLFYLLVPALYVNFAPDAYKWAPFSRPYEYMLVAVFAALGICLLMASTKPLTNIIIIDFTILSSIFSGAFLTYSAFTQPGETIHLFLDIPLFYLIALILIILYPRNLKSIKELD